MCILHSATFNILSIWDLGYLPLSALLLSILQHFDRDHSTPRAASLHLDNPETPHHSRALKESGGSDGALFSNWQTWPNTLQVSCAVYSSFAMSEVEQFLSIWYHIS